jgi:hypothetical protein
VFGLHGSSVGQPIINCNTREATRAADHRRDRHVACPHRATDRLNAHAGVLGRFARGQQRLRGQGWRLDEVRSEPIRELADRMLVEQGWEHSDKLAKH